MLAAPLVAWTIGMNTPSINIVTSTVASAAKLDAELRRVARIASRRKNPIRIDYSTPGGGVDGARSRLARSRVVSSPV